MAETKYDLLLCQTKKDEKIYPKPWYKERIREKHIKSIDPNSSTRHIDGKNWTFLRPGLDDFRNGQPPPITDDIFIRGTKGISPVLTGTSESKAGRHSSTKSGFSKHEMCYSKVSPMQEQRKENIEMIERALKRHPLALYPNLEECLPPELFEDVIAVLDPEMAIRDSVVDNQDDGSLASSTDRPAVYEVEEKADHPPAVHLSGQEAKMRNPYRWLPDSDDAEKHDKNVGAVADEDDEHIKTVTQEFCDWVASLGGDAYNIEESTITSLFASGYETKPALSVPIHVVELANVPAELRMSAAPTASFGKQSARTQTGGSSDRLKTYQPSWVKYRYGAWYLDPKQWRRQPITEPLRDPNDTKDKEISEAKQKSLELDYDLAPMHGVKLFKDFVGKKEIRRPEFLEHVSEIQEQQQREELEHHETEPAKRVPAKGSK